MKTTKTYSIEESLYDSFDNFANENNLNKSSFFEDAIKKYLSDNELEVIGIDYELKTDSNYIVTLLSQNKIVCNLKNGDKIQRTLFYDIFKPVIGVDPNEFFSRTASIFEDILNKVKNDVTDVFPDSLVSHTKNIKTYDTNHEIKIDIKSPITSISDANEIDEQVTELSHINTDFRNLEYLTKSKFDICKIIVKLKLMNFYDDKKSEELRDLLIHIYTEHKDTIL